MREDNVLLAKQGYDAFSRGDLDAIRDVLSDDAVWRIPVTAGFEAEYKGIDEILGYMVSVAERSSGTLTLQCEALMADDDHVAAIDHITGRRDGKMLDTRVVHVYEVRDGKVVDVTEYVADQHAMDTFWS